MFRTTSLVFLMAITVACGKSGSSGGAATEEANEVNLTDVPVTTPDVPEAAITFKTNVDLISMTATQEKKMEKALEIVRLVIETEEFRDKVLNHKYNGKKTFVDNGGYTNEQIYKKILEGAEKFKPAKNNTMDMGVEMYTASTNVVGYTYPTATQIWVNTKYFNQYTAAGVAHNLVHEWLHKLGFGHSSSATPSRPYSVPYAIGYMVMEIGKDFL